MGGIEEKEFKGTNLQSVDKPWRSNAQYRDYRPQDCVTNFKVAKRLDLNHSHQKKKKKQNKKLQYFGHLMRRVDSLEKTLMLEGIGAGGKGDDRR